MKYQVNDQLCATPMPGNTPTITTKCSLLVFFSSLKYFLSMLPLLLLTTACGLDQIEEAVGLGTEVSFDTIALSYPATATNTDVVDQYFGYTVADPYRWLENGQDERVRTWSAAQQQNTDQYLQQIPFRAAITEELNQLSAFQQYGLPQYQGQFYYLRYNDGSWPKPVLARVQQFTDSVTVVLNPNTWPAGATYELGAFAFSADGRYLVYEQRPVQGEESILRIVDVQDRTRFEDAVQVRGLTSLNWHEQGFYYTTYPEPAAGKPQSFHQLRFHALGTHAGKDELVFADYRNPESRITAFVDTTSHQLVLEVEGQGLGNAAYFRALDSDDPSFTPLVEHQDYRFRFAGGSATDLYFVTDLQADNGRLIKVKIDQPERRYWEDLLAEQQTDVLQEAWYFSGQWMVHYLRDATSFVLLLDENGQETRRVFMPESGTLAGVSRGKHSQELFFSFTSFLRPPTIYRLDLNQYRSALLYAPHPGFKAEDYQMQLKWVRAYDDVSIPVFLLHRKDLVVSEGHFTLLLAAGSDANPLVPAWNPTGQMLVPAILAQGGVVAVANVRGSNGFGRQWRNAGILERAQKRLDDVQAVAEYLREQSYVDPNKLTAYGAGAGATLVMASLNQRPDLFTAVAAESGWYDLLRYHQFPGAAEQYASFGTSQDSLQNDHLLSYSPLHNVVPSKFPATFLLAPKVTEGGVPLHARKLAAAMQAQQVGAAPILLAQDAADEAEVTTNDNTFGADLLSFLFYQTKTTWK